LKAAPAAAIKAANDPTIKAIRRIRSFMWFTSYVGI
jgi:hypothetical protein